MPFTHEILHQRISKKCAFRFLFFDIVRYFLLVSFSFRFGGKSPFKSVRISGIVWHKNFIENVQPPALSPWGESCFFNLSEDAWEEINSVPVERQRNLRQRIVEPAVGLDGVENKCDLLSEGGIEEVVLELIGWILIKIWDFEILKIKNLMLTCKHNVSHSCDDVTWWVTICLLRERGSCQWLAKHE